MALITGQYPIEAALIDLGTGALNQAAYASGGTALGEVLSSHAIGFQRAGSLKKGFNTPFWKYFKDFGFNVMYEVILAERSQQHVALMSNRQFDSGQVLDHGRFNGSNKKLGQIIHYDSAEVHRLMLRSSDTTKPSVLIPAAICLEIGTHVWELKGDHLQGAVLTIAGLWHPTLGGPYVDGDVSHWPDIAALGSVGGDY